MAGFTENIKLIIDVSADKAQSSLKSLAQEVQSADGAFAKLKVGASKGLDIVANSPAAMVAVTGAAAKGIFSLAEGFTKSALAAGQFADATGLSVDASSRLIEVASDIGVSSGAVESAINRMNKTAANSPAAFDAIGAAIVRAKDGSVDVQATFLNVIDALNRIPDPAERAAAASKILGKGWTEMAELIGLGAKGVVQAMKDVNSGIAISDAELEKAKRFRDNLDQLKDSGKQVGMVLGGAAADSLGRFFGAIDKGSAALDKVSSGLGDIVAQGGISGFGQLIDDVSGKVTGLGKAGADLSGGLNAGTVSVGGLANATRDLSAALVENTNAQLAAFDATFAVTNATDNFAKAHLAAVTAAQSSTASAGEQRQAYDEETQAAEKAALAIQAKAEKDAVASGTALTATQSNNVLIGALQTLAGQASGPTAAALQALIAKLQETGNQKPKPTVDINDQATPRVSAVQNLLSVVGRTVATAGIRADDQTSGPFAAAQARGSAWAGKVFTATIRTITTGVSAVGAVPGGATGGPHSGVTLVGEKGPELVDLPGGSYIHTADETKRMLSAGMPGSAQGIGGNNITINLPIGSDPTATRRAIDRYALRNGSR